MNLLRVPTKGGTAENVSGKSFPFVSGRFSPDGNSIGLLLYEGERGERIKLAVVDAHSGSFKGTFDTPASGSVPDNSWWVGRQTEGGSPMLCRREAARIYGFSQSRADHLISSLIFRMTSSLMTGRRTAIV